MSRNAAEPDPKVMRLLGAVIGLTGLGLIWFVLGFWVAFALTCVVTGNNIDRTWNLVGELGAAIDAMCLRDERNH